MEDEFFNLPHFEGCVKCVLKKIGGCSDTTAN